MEKKFTHLLNFVLGYKDFKEDPERNFERTKQDLNKISSWFDLISNDNYIKALFVLNKLGFLYFKSLDKYGINPKTIMTIKTKFIDLDIIKEDYVSDNHIKYFKEIKNLKDYHINAMNLYRFSREANNFFDVFLPMFEYKLKESFLSRLNQDLYDFNNVHKVVYERKNTAQLKSKELDSLDKDIEEINSRVNSNLNTNSKESSINMFEDGLDLLNKLNSSSEKNTSNPHFRALFDIMEFFYLQKSLPKNPQKIISDILNNYHLTKNQLTWVKPLTKKLQKTGELLLSGTLSEKEKSSIFSSYYLFRREIDSFHLSKVKVEKIIKNTI